MGKLRPLHSSSQWPAQELSQNKPHRKTYLSRKLMLPLLSIPPYWLAGFLSSFIHGRRRLLLSCQMGHGHMDGLHGRKLLGAHLDPDILIMVRGCLRHSLSFLGLCRSNLHDWWTRWDQSSFHCYALRAQSAHLHHRQSIETYSMIVLTLSLFRKLAQSKTE